eukprot:COSAG02_NODE_4749_length_5026_cov_795.119139_1_plen_909_part_00
MGLFGKKLEPEPEIVAAGSTGDADGDGMEESGAKMGGVRWQRAHRSLALKEDGAVAHGDGGFRCAMGAVVLRRGQHFAEFTIVTGRRVMLGVVRPDWSVDGWGDGSAAQQCHHVGGHAFYSSADGRCFPGNAEWRGAQAARAGDRMGLLLDLDEGSMTLCKNDERLGLMLPKGSLSGEFCWAVGMVRSARGDCVRIVSAPVPECLKVRLSKKEKKRLATRNLKGSTKEQSLQPTSEEPETADPSGVFARAHPTITLSDCGGGSEACSSRGYRAAASSDVMSEGQHFVEFVISFIGPPCIPGPDRNSSGGRQDGGVNVLLGVIRPQWDVELGQEPEEVGEHCFFNCRSGYCFPNRAEWEGMEPLSNRSTPARVESQSDGEGALPVRLGMLLDLDTGSLAIYKNGRRLGVMADGLCGEYCWAVSMLGDQGECVTITSNSKQTATQVEATAQQLFSHQVAAERAQELHATEAARAKQLHAQRVEQEVLAGLTNAAEAVYSERGFLRFDLCHPSLIASEQTDGTSVFKTHSGSDRFSGYRTAASAVVMRTGVHFAQFTIEAEYIVYIGLVAAAWDVTTGRDAHLQYAHVFWESLYGKRYPFPLAPAHDVNAALVPTASTNPKDDQRCIDDDQRRQNQLLLSAAADGDAEAVRHSLEAGANPQATDSNGWNAIVLAIRGDHVGVLEVLWGAPQPQLEPSKPQSEGSASGSGSGSESESEDSESESNSLEGAVEVIGADHQRQCMWRDEVAEMLTVADEWGRTPMMYAAMLHHRLWPHDATEGETESLEWLKGKLGLTLGATPADAAEVDWRRKNSVGGEWEGRQGAISKGDRIGMLLDLEQGTLTLYKNDTMLGLMVSPAHVASEGVVPLRQSHGWRWAVSLMRPGDTVSIEAFESPEAAATAALDERALLAT